MKKFRIRVKVLDKAHVAQLSLEHYWPWEKRFDFTTVHVLGRMAKTGDVLCLDKRSNALRLISVAAYIDWQFAQVGGILPNGDYAPTPHTIYSQHARARYYQLDQLFVEG